MKIAIKTKDRVERFREKTYSKIIKHYDFDETLVHLFVSNDTDVENYSKAYPRCKVIKGPDGICQIDNFIVDYFDEGEVYLYMNDDVSGIYEATSKKELKLVEDLKSLLNKLVKECKDNHYSYAGFAPVCNAYFMYGQKPINKGFSLVMDPLSICINNKDVKLTPIPVPMPDGSIFNGESSDAEKCILHYKSRGGIIRFNHYAPKVEYFGKVGGYQGRNAYTQKYTAEFMLNKYPEYISGINFKKNGTTSLRLRRKPKEIIKPKIFVISLDNEEGKRRRSLLNYEYEWIKAETGLTCDPWIVEKMKNRHNIKFKTKIGKLGCFASYMKVFNKIVNEKLNNVIILEDDCILLQKFFVEKLGKKPIYLNGVFQHPLNYSKSTKKWRDTIKIDKNGINKIDYSKFRISGTIGIYFPKFEQVKKIVDDIMSLDKITSIDNLLIKMKSIERFYYPSLYKHDDGNNSCIRDKGYGIIQDYKFQ